MPAISVGDQQHILGLPETMIEELWHMQNSTINTNIAIYTSSDRQGSVIPYVLFGVMFCVGLYCMMCCTRWCPCLSLYSPEGRCANLVLVGYNIGVLVLLQRLTFVVIQLGQSFMA
jgi:hypothetical protein